LAHELRNPLAPIRNALHILKLAPEDTATTREARDMAERQVHHLTRLVDDLLDVSRVMRGRIDLRRERTQLSSVFARAVETARPSIDNEGHTLSVALPEQPVWLEADVVRLAQVIANLLSNAAKYTERGGQIWLSACPAGSRVEITVRDNGIGIAPEMLPRLFDMFVQVAPSASRSQGGLGIGLTLVKNLVELHGGSVEAKSAGLGEGSEFVVRLPVIVEPERGNGDTSADAEGPPAARRILVVDDNVDAADSLAVLLRLQGHNVRVAHGGQDALDAVASDPPELVLLDIGMPGMNGYEVARRLRSHYSADELILVALTGWGQEQDRQRSRDAGFDFHLTKPVEFKALEIVLASQREPAPQ
jgi:CheY-like chemotaxis protein